VASEPIQERIIQDVEASLALINGAGAYHYALTTILERGDEWPEKLDQLPAAGIRAVGKEVCTLGPGGLVTRHLPLTAEARLQTDEDPDTAASRLIADLERAVTADPRRAGLAIDTNMTGNERTITPTPGVLVEVEIELLVHYRTRQGDPATAG
jgi:hypothetical protein